jgi:predicted NUDIX family NTP pyrophosphohydrolase
VNLETVSVAAKRSAGILLFRRTSGRLEVLLGHMGGPFWQRKDDGAWSIPKGEYELDEQPTAAARREFTEELGLPVPDGVQIPLGEIRQSGGKTVIAWAVEGEVDPEDVVPGTFELEWPPKSGTLSTFAEVDRVGWFDLDSAAAKIVVGQRPFLSRLAEHCSAEDDSDQTA